MGLYYNPIPPHIGAQQPLTPRKLTPPISGPTPTNPPFPGAQVAQAILVSWAVLTIPPAPVVARNLTPPSAPVPAPVFKRYEYAVHNAWIPPPPAPQTALNLDPPVSGPVITLPLFKRYEYGIHVAWLPLPPAPIVAINTDPPISGPPPQNPPFMGGARISQPVLNAWLPPAPMPVLPVLLDPPISGPQNPPFPGARVPVEVQVAWLPPPPTPTSHYLAENFAPLLPVPATYTPIGSRMPVAVQVAWLPPPPMPQPPINLDPPRNGPPINNPFFPGARVPVAVQVSWLPRPPQPPAVRNVSIATAPVTGVLAASEAADTAQFTVQVRNDAPGILNFGRRVTINRW